MNFIEACHHEANAHSYPDLGPHGVFTGAVKGLDAEVLFNPFEEQLDSPTAFIDCRDGDGGQFEVIGQENQALARYRIDEANVSGNFVFLLRSSDE